MRPRTIREMLRDSHAGSIIVAELIALGLANVLAAISWPLNIVLASVMNYVVVNGLRNYAAPFAPFTLNTQLLLYIIGGPLLTSVSALLTAYLIAVWVYTPEKRVRRLRTLVPKGSSLR